MPSIPGLIRYPENPVNDTPGPGTDIPVTTQPIANQTDGPLSSMVKLSLLVSLSLLALAVSDPTPQVCPLSCSVPPSSALSSCASVTKYSVCQTSPSWSTQDERVARYLDGLGVSAKELVALVERGKKKKTKSKESSSPTDPPSENAVAAGKCAGSLLSLLCMSSFPPCEIGTETKSVCHSACTAAVRTCAASPDVVSLPQSFCASALGYELDTVDQTDLSKNPPADSPGCVHLSYEGANHLMWIAGFTIAGLFSFLAALGFNLQKLSMNREQHRRPLSSPRRPPLRQPLWFLGMSLITCGSLLDFVAFGLAPASLLAPLGALSLVWNMYLAPAFNGERLSAESARATAIICVGTLMTVIFAAHATPTYTLEDLLLLYREPVMVGYVLAVAAFMCFLFKTLKALELGSDVKKMIDKDTEEQNPLLSSSLSSSFSSSSSVLPTSYNPSSPVPVTQSTPLAAAKIRPSRSNSFESNSNSNSSSNNNSNSSFAASSVGFLAAAAATPSKAKAAVLEWSRAPSLFESTEMQRIVCYGGIAGVFGGCSVLLGKSTAELVKNVMTGDDDGAFTHFAPFAIIFGMLASLLTQITVLNHGLSKFNALLMVPVYQSFWNTSSVLGGIIYFQEYRDMGAFQALFFGCGIAVTLMGVDNLLRERINEVNLGPQRSTSLSISAGGESAGGEDSFSDCKEEENGDDQERDWNCDRRADSPPRREGRETPPHGAIELKSVMGP